MSIKLNNFKPDDNDKIISLGEKMLKATNLKAMDLKVGDLVDVKALNLTRQRLLKIDACSSRATISCPRGQHGSYWDDRFTQHIKRVDLKELGKNNADFKFEIGEYVNVFNAREHLPDNFFAVGKKCLDRKFKILSRKKNRYSTDYFIEIDENDGGRFSSTIKKYGWWMREEWLELGFSENEKEDNDPHCSVSASQEKVETMDNTNQEITNSSSDHLQNWNGKEVRLYGTILPSMVELGTTAIRYLLNLGLRAANKSAKVIQAWIVAVEDFFDSNPKETEGIIQWILGFLAKNLHKLRQIPGIKDLSVLQFLEHEQIQKFGYYAEFSAEGDVLGEVTRRVLSWVQEKIFGSGALLRITEAIENPEKLARIAGELNAGMKRSLEDDSKALEEAVRVEVMKTASAAAA